MDVTSFLIYCTIATFTPGPTNIVILSTVNKFGAKKAMKYAYGATAGFGSLLIISAILNALLLTIIPKILIVIQIIGSGYMLFLAYQIFKTDTSNRTVNQSATFMSGFLMQFLNPKVVLFAITVIPSFIISYYNTFPAITVSIITITMIGFSAFTTWVLFGTIFKAFIRKYNRFVNVIMAIFLAYAAIMIWI
ncbi:LysE family translocator [Paenibacillus sp. YIM B09110]|uniref:LysE family translocator n=1 Tax=Paenibacillus sp. YIM B09110 TaxID=3126102 RepID=UPI00301B7DF6